MQRGAQIIADQKVLGAAEQCVPPGGKLVGLGVLHQQPLGIVVIILEEHDNTAKAEDYNRGCGIGI